MQLNVPEGLKGSDTALTWATRNTKWTNRLPNCVQKNIRYIQSIPTVITKVQIINFMSKVSNKFRHHNTLRGEFHTLTMFFGEEMIIF